jgi:ribosomal protein L11 methyltransferase
MHWTEVIINVHRESAGVVEQRLEEAGALAVTLQDGADHPLLEPEPGTTPLWPAVRVTGLFARDVRRERVVDSLQGLPGTERPEYLRWRTLEDQDWARAWMDRFEPMRFGERLWIVPTGMPIPHDPENIEIRLDPGLAFGTGTHPTTALCLEWLDSQSIAGLNVVDYGCGSGVLGIAAALKGANRVIGVDNDPQALEATRDNAIRNGVHRRLELRSPDDYAPRPADIVLANILAAPLIELAPVLLASLRRGGAIVLSGILEEQAESVVDAYRDGLSDWAIDGRDGWVRLAGVRS